jgi:acyl carrier protein
MNCFEEFKKIISTRVKNPNDITLESNLKDLGLDSLDLLEIVTEGEEKLNIRFEDDELVSFKTVGDVVKSAERKL